MSAADIYELHKPEMIVSAMHRGLSVIEYFHAFIVSFCEY